MILEALEYLTTPCPDWARRLGYLSEAIGIRHRAKRCAEAWAPHQKRTKQAILEACPSNCSSAVLLGAGLCLDIPIRRLAAQCRQVTLVDAVRLRGISLPKNVHYRTHDVHGIAEALNGGRSLMDNRAAPLARYQSADFIVSVNLISQLAMLPIRHVEKEGLSSPDFEHGIRGKVMREHVADLKLHPGRALLIGDASRRAFDASGALVSEENLAAEALLPTPDDFWTWQIVPPGEDSRGITVESTVGIWNL